MCLLLPLGFVELSRLSVTLGRISGVSMLILPLLSKLQIKAACQVKVADLSCGESISSMESKCAAYVASVANETLECLSDHQ